MSACAYLFLWTLAVGISVLLATVISRAASTKKDALKRLATRANGVKSRFRLIPQTAYIVIGIFVFSIWISSNLIPSFSTVEPCDKNGQAAVNAMIRTVKAIPLPLASEAIAATLEDCGCSND